MRYYRNGHREHGHGHRAPARKQQSRLAMTRTRAAFRSFLAVQRVDYMAARQI